MTTRTHAHNGGIGSGCGLPGADVNPGNAGVRTDKLESVMAAKPGKWLDDGEKEPWALRRFMGAIGGLAVLLLAGSLDTLCKKKTKTKRFFCHTQSFFSKRWDSFETFRNVSKRFETFFTKFFFESFRNSFFNPSHEASVTWQWILTLAGM